MTARLAGSLPTACVLAVASIASAQITTGSITGTVRDVQGGVIPGATVILTSDTHAALAPGVTGTSRIGDCSSTGGGDTNIQMDGVSTMDTGSNRAIIDVTERRV